MTDIVHLHVHSQFSLLQATPTVEELAAQAKKDGLGYLACTDTAAMYGAVRFVQACDEHGIQPILGMCVPVQQPALGAQEITRLHPSEPGILILIAQTPQGYRSLCQLSTTIQARPQRRQIVQLGISLDEIKACSQGLICLSGGRRGWIEWMVRRGDLAGAGRVVGDLAGVFGDRFYLSLEIHRPEDEELARSIQDIGERFGIDAVTVHPIYTMEPSDRQHLSLLAAIESNIRLDEVQPTQLVDGGDADIDLHWLSPEAMRTRYGGFPQAMANTLKIAEQCRRPLPGGTPIWPSLDLPAGKTPAQVLAERAEDGTVNRYGPNPSVAVRDRLHHELNLINTFGFSPLFLLVADIVRFARLQDIPVSTRGSVANSLVAYSLGITSVDPIAHDLLFERFLNPARTDAPDIDLDFCSRRRDEVLAYLRDRYGADRMALVATVSTMRPKSALRECAKALALDEKTITSLVRRLRQDWHPDPRRRSRDPWQEETHEYQDDQERRVVELAKRLVGIPHHLSIHPGGVVIAPQALTHYLPLQWSPKGFLITQYDHSDVETIGFPKVDLLGIRALTVLDDSAALVRQHHQPGFRLADIPLDDPRTADLLATGDTIGVFQCESSGARRTLRQLGARTVSDLAVANAFFKPGPATGGMASMFIKRYRGEEPTTYLHPALAPILAQTKGVLIFQEQVLRIATQLAGLDWEQANHLRRGMSKFRAEEMASMRDQFLSGCQRKPPQGPGMSSQQAQVLWDQVIAFAGYGFNQGHATAYADVSYRSAYLKAHWPAAFLCARLRGWGGFHHPAIYMAEAQRLGIDVRPPHVNHSLAAFTLSWDTQTNGQITPVLWMGLASVHSLRRSSVQAIVHERQRYPYRDLEDFTRRLSMQKKEIVHLVQCGAFDGLGTSRTSLLDEADRITAGHGAQLTFEFLEISDVAESPAQRMQWEHTILGQPISVHPLEVIGKRPAGTTELAELERFPGRQVEIVGVRLPGWTGGKGFFLGDGRTYVIAIPARPDRSLKPWIPHRLRGRWQVDAWGMGWFNVDALSELV